MFNAIHIHYLQVWQKKNSVVETVDINNHYELTNERAIDKMLRPQQIINAQKKMNTKKLIISASISKQVFETSPHSNYDRNFIALNLQKKRVFFHRASDK